ncbi:Ppx/GppA phosphatase family protein [Candidatus Nitrospira bockiana]
MLLAGVDIGTLTCRLLIADVTEGRLTRVLHADRRILRLGQGVDERGTLDPAAMTRVVETLKEWRREIGRHSVQREIAVATSAVRDAANRQSFLDRVKRETGFEVEVIDGEEEARRTMLGIRSGLPPGTREIIGLDIGGGSTEFILDRPGRPPAVRSFDLGVVRLAERCFNHDPPTADELAAARDWVARCTTEVRPMIGASAAVTFVGTAGTITSLAAMAQRLQAYDAARVHGYRLNLSTIRVLERDLLSRSQAERVGMPGLEPGREEVIAAGVVILSTVMETLGFHECLVSDLGLREGVLLDLAERIKQE